MLSRIVRPAASRLTAQSSRLPEPSCRRQISTDPAEYFHYTRAVVGSLTNSFIAGSLRAEEPTEPIDLGKAKRDHEHYVRELKKLIPDTVQIPPNEDFPDMVFVEDPAVVHGGKALMTNMRPSTRSQETGIMRPVLRELGLQIVETDDAEAFIDGGDVLFTGREFLVGLSRRTNAVSGGSLLAASYIGALVPAAAN